MQGRLLYSQPEERVPWCMGLAAGVSPGDAAEGMAVECREAEVYPVVVE
jgi:hypothetical protein